MFATDKADIDEGNIAMLEAIVTEMPLRALGMMGVDKLPKYFIEGIVDMLNGKFYKGLGLLLKK